MANLVSLIRTLLALVVISLLFVPTQAVYLACFGLTVLVIWMDGLDGYLARKLGESSKAGAVIDILGDRVVEQVYWVSFLALGWVPLWIPLVIIIRGVVVDGMRSVAFEQGYTAFGKASLQQSPWATFLVASNASRWLYAVIKACAFAFSILAHTPGLDAAIAQPLSVFATACIYGSVFFCVIRGLPVLIESRRFFARSEAS